MRWLVLWVVVGCARPAFVPDDPPSALPADQVRRYTIWLSGARGGTATETETWSRQGVALTRSETLRFLRGETEVELATTIEIDADGALVAHRVRWTERTATRSSAHRGVSDPRSAEAWRGRDGWQVGEGHGAAWLPAHAVPAELVPLLIRRDGHFAGTVFFPARGFVTGEGRIDPIAPGRLVALISLATGPVAEATINLDRDGSPARVVDGEGVIAIRATRAQVDASFPAVDLIAATALPIAGASPHRGHRIVLEGDLALPPVPGQAAVRSGDGIELELGSRLPGDLPAGPAGPDRRAEIMSLVASVRSRITPDLGANPTSIRDAAAATAGDCTTFALAYAALAERRAIPTRVVTGLRVDGDRLVRHRWAVSWTGRAWIAVDAAFGAAPAGGDLIGLAVNDADAAGLVAGETALMQVRAAAWVTR